MQGSDITIIWFIGGIALMLLELLLPGGIVFFLGLGGTIVALLLYAGIIDGWLQAFTAWFIGSLALLFGLRDEVVDFAQAKIMNKILKKEGKPVTLIALDNEDHFLSESETRIQTLKEVVAFLDRHLESEK